MHCLSCSKSLTLGKRNYKDKKFCNNACQQSYNFSITLKEFLEERLVGKLIQFRGKLRDYLLEIANNRCQHCGISEWQNKPIILEINHKDGDALNNTLNNLEAICPNCHSQTSTYRAKNKNGKRHYRRKIRV